MGTKSRVVHVLLVIPAKPEKAAKEELFYAG